jgi:hypothetical protein
MKLTATNLGKGKRLNRGKIIGAIMMIGFSAAAAAESICPISNPSCNEPAWEIYCASLIPKGIPCTAATFSEGIRYGTPSTMTLPAVPAYTAAGWGNTHAAVATNFGAVQLSNFQTNPSIDSQMTNIDPGTMAQLSVEIWRLAPSDVAGIYVAAAQRLSAANLAKMRAAFGPTMDAYIADNTPAAVLAQYSAITPYPALPYSQYSGTPFPPASDMTYTDLYLNAYTSEQNQTQQVAAQSAILYGQIRFGDKGFLTTLGRFIAGPTGQAVMAIFTVVSAIDSEWPSQLADAGKALVKYCGDDSCGYETTTLTPPSVIPTPTPAVVPPDPDPSAQDVPVPAASGGNLQSTPLNDGVL